MLKRDIRRPEHILNRDPLDFNYNRMGMIEKRRDKLLRIALNSQQTEGNGFTTQSSFSNSPVHSSGGFSQITAKNPLLLTQTDHNDNAVAQS